MQNLFKANSLALKAYQQIDPITTLRLFQQNAERYPHVITLNNLAWYYLYELENREKAVALLEEIQEYGQNFFPPEVMRGDVALFQKDYIEAAMHYQRALRRDSHPTVLHNLGITLALLGDYVSASRHLTVAVADGGETPSVLALLKSLWLAENKNQLLSHLAEKEMVPVEEHLFLAQIWYGLENYDDAVAYFEKAMENYAPQWQWIEQYLYSLLAVGRRKEAFELRKDLLLQLRTEFQHVRTQIEGMGMHNQEELRQAQNRFVYLTTSFKGISQANLENWTEKPPLDFSITAEDMLVDCYLYGCPLHGHYPVTPKLYKEGLQKENKAENTPCSTLQPMEIHARLER